MSSRLTIPHSVSPYAAYRYDDSDDYGSDNWLFPAIATFFVWQCANATKGHELHRAYRALSLGFLLFTFRVLVADHPAIGVHLILVGKLLAAISRTTYSVLSTLLSSLIRNFLGVLRLLSIAFHAIASTTSATSDDLWTFVTSRDEEDSLSGALDRPLHAIIILCVLTLLVCGFYHFDHFFTPSSKRFIPDDHVFHASWMYEGAFDCSFQCMKPEPGRTYGFSYDGEDEDEEEDEPSPAPEPGRTYGFSYDDNEDDDEPAPEPVPEPSPPPTPLQRPREARHSSPTRPVARRRRRSSPSTAPVPTSKPRRTPPASPDRAPSSPSPSPSRPTAPSEAGGELPAPSGEPVETPCAPGAPTPAPAPTRTPPPTPTPQPTPPHIRPPSGFYASARVPPPPARPIPPWRPQLRALARPAAPTIPPPILRPAFVPSAQTRERAQLWLAALALPRAEERPGEEEEQPAMAGPSGASVEPPAAAVAPAEDAPPAGGPVPAGDNESPAADDDVEMSERDSLDDVSLDSEDRAMLACIVPDYEGSDEDGDGDSDVNDAGNDEQGSASDSALSSLDSNASYIHELANEAWMRVSDGDEDDSDEDDDDGIVGSDEEDGGDRPEVHFADPEDNALSRRLRRLQGMS